MHITKDGDSPRATAFYLAGCETLTKSGEVNPSDTPEVHINNKATPLHSSSKRGTLLAYYSRTNTSSLLPPVQGNVTSIPVDNDTDSTNNTGSTYVSATGRPDIDPQPTTEYMPCTDKRNECHGDDAVPFLFGTSAHTTTTTTTTTAAAVEDDDNNSAASTTADSSTTAASSTAAASTSIPTTIASCTDSALAANTTNDATDPCTPSSPKKPERAAYASKIPDCASVPFCESAYCAYDPLPANKKGVKQGKCRLCTGSTEKVFKGALNHFREHVDSKHNPYFEKVPTFECPFPGCTQKFMQAHNVPPHFWQHRDEPLYDEVFAASIKHRMTAAQNADYEAYIKKAKKIVDQREMLKRLKQRKINGEYLHYIISYYYTLLYTTIVHSVH